MIDTTPSSFTTWLASPALTISLVLHQQVVLQVLGEVVLNCIEPFLVHISNKLLDGLMCQLIRGQGVCLLRYFGQHVLYQFQGSVCLLKAPQQTSGMPASGCGDATPVYPAPIILFYICCCACLLCLLHKLVHGHGQFQIHIPMSVR